MDRIESSEPNQIIEEEEEEESGFISHIFPDTNFDSIGFVLFFFSFRSQ